MFRLIKYQLIELKPTLKITNIIAINCGETGIVSVMNTEKRLVIIDWVDAMLVEFTGKYDKVGKEIYTGDLLRSWIDKEIYLVGWSNGGFTANCLKDQSKSVPLFDESWVMLSEKLGNQFENQDIVIEYLKPLADEKMEGTDGEIGGVAK